MKKLFCLFSLLLGVVGFNTNSMEAGPYVVVTASNDVNGNELIVYDSNGKFLESIPTGGAGGVDPNIVGGGIAKNNGLLAVINYGSQSVSLFQQNGSSFEKMQTISSLSKPVSVAFGHNHLYILGTTTIESHKMIGKNVAERPDGSSGLYVGDGSAAQVGVLNNQLIISERSNTIELVDLRNGVVTTSITPVELPPPPGNDTPVGLATRGDVAYVTIAHSNKVGMVKNGQLVKVLSSGSQNAPCWLTLMGPWLFCSNTPSKTISRYTVSESNMELAELIAAKIPTGEPSDIDAADNILGVLDTGGGAAHVSQLQINNNGKLRIINSAPTAATANGIAVVPVQSSRTR